MMMMTPPRHFENEMAMMKMPNIIENLWRRQHDLAVTVSDTQRFA